MRSPRRPRSPVLGTSSGRPRKRLRLSAVIGVLAGLLANLPKNEARRLNDLFAELRALPPDERELWLNTFISQINAEESVWPDGAPDWDSAVNAEQLELLLEALTADAEDAGALIQDFRAEYERSAAD